MKKDKESESRVLDYKRERIENKKLLQHICGFANAQGGHLVFGVEESDDKPPIPKRLPGLTKKDFNVEQIEQIINSNIDPPLKVEISPPIFKSNKNKEFFIVIRVPEGPDKPYMSTVDDRYYIRRNYQTPRMSEIEISSMYRQRFSTPQRVKEYLEKTISYNNEVSFLKKDKEKPIIFGHIFVFPPNVEIRRIGKIDDKTLDRRNEDVPSFCGRTISLKDNLCLPILRGYNSLGLMWYEHESNNRLEVHRNYLIHHVEDYGRIYDKWALPVSYIADKHLTSYFLLTLYFSDWAYNEIDYFGPLNVMLQIANMKNIRLFGGEISDIWPLCVSQRIEIEREINSWELANKYVEIVKSMMDEFMNYFGRYEYEDFNKGGAFEHLLGSKDIEETD